MHFSNVGTYYSKMTSVLRSEQEYLEIWKHYREKVGCISPESEMYQPDFLAISPAKTCSTWLYDNLILHPDVFMKAKEINYFSAFWQWYDINWYLKGFLGGQWKCKGDVSGTYSLLPFEAVRYIHTLFPRLKIIIVLRHPAERTWSQIRHYYRFKVGPFKDYTGQLENVSLADLTTKFWVDSYVQWSDYPSMFNRWLSFFSPDNMFVCFTDSIATNPETVLRDLFHFLGLNAPVGLSTFPFNHFVLKGLDIDISRETDNFLTSLFQKTLEDTDELLKRRFEMAVPSTWTEKESNPRMAHDQFFTNHLLPNRDEDQNALPRYMESFLDYNILFYEGLFHAVSHQSGEIDLHVLNHDTRKELAASGDYFCKRNPEELKEHIKTVAYLKA